MSEIDLKKLGFIVLSPPRDYEGWGRAFGELTASWGF